MTWRLTHATRKLHGFTFTDPREPEIIRYVGYGPAPFPWRLLTDFRDHGTGSLYDWLRELDRLGLEPDMPLRYTFGLVERYSEANARNTANMLTDILRARPLEQTHPLLNRISPGIRRRITATDSEETVIEFESITAAEMAGFTRSCIYRAMQNNRPYRGYVWRAEDTQHARRPVDRVSWEGEITSYPSMAAASRATGISRTWITRLLRTAEHDAEYGRWRFTPERPAQKSKPKSLQVSCSHSWPTQGRPQSPSPFKDTPLLAQKANSATFSRPTPRPWR